LNLLDTNGWVPVVAAIRQSVAAGCDLDARMGLCGIVNPPVADAASILKPTKAIFFSRWKSMVCRIVGR
jgi:hypothetical protein